MEGGKSTLGVDAASDLARRFAGALDDHLAEVPGALERAARIGHEALASGVGAMELVQGHREALARALGTAARSEQAVRIATRGAEVLAASLSPLEAQRADLCALQADLLQRDDFLAIASHEFKTPLTTLSIQLQFAEQALRAGRTVPPTVMERARVQVERLTALIHALLDLSQIRLGRPSLQLEPVAVDETARTVVAEWQRLDARHAIVLERSAGPSFVLADAPRLEQVLANLLENAVKFSPGGGTIRVAVVRGGGEVRISVEDPGIGIPGDQRARLFERYFRARNAPVVNFAGLGLGLYLTRDMVERMGGRILVDSELGRGSTFHVILPELQVVAAMTGAP